MTLMLGSLVSLASSLLVTGFAFALGCHEEAGPWQARLEQIVPLLGHRDWILIVDSAYPLQTTTGVETVETNAGHIEVIGTVLSGLDHSIHVRPIVYMDAELPFVPEQDAPGVTAYRKALKGIMAGRAVQSLPHKQIAGKIDSGKSFRLVLKTRMTVPYTSIFLQLDCKYWNDAAEQQLRQAMSQGSKK